MLVLVIMYVGIVNVGGVIFICFFLVFNDEIVILLLLIIVSILVLLGFGISFVYVDYKR